MIKLNHLAILVRSYTRSRDWYVRNFGLKVELKYRELSDRGVAFEKPPQKLFWGYGAELRDPDGYLVYLWDERTMREKGGG